MSTHSRDPHSFSDAARAVTLRSRSLGAALVCKSLLSSGHPKPFRRHGCGSSNFLRGLNLSAPGEQKVESEALVAVDHVDVRLLDGGSQCHPSFV
jgi:hypothetical protein